MLTRFTLKLINNEAGLAIVNKVNKLVVECPKEHLYRTSLQKVDDPFHDLELIVDVQYHKRDSEEVNLVYTSNVGAITVNILTQALGEPIYLQVSPKTVFTRHSVSPSFIPEVVRTGEIASLVQIEVKHYFAEKAIEEGRVLPEPELEKKGVGYISARHDAKIERNVEEYFVDDIIAKVKEKIYLSVDDVLGRPLRLEKETRDTIRSGGLIYQTDNIKEPKSYKQGEGNATYKQFLLWQEIFAPTYGTVDEPPYSAYKVPVALSKKRDIQDWFDRIEDRAIAARAKKFFEEQNITQMSGILVPTQIAELIGIPKEIVLAADEKRATSQIMGPFYLALGGLGFFHGNNNNTKLITDHLFRAKSQDQLSTVSCPNPIESV